jgi:hypothetical protein
MGRKPKADDARRGEWLHIRLTRSERAELAERADLEDIPVSDLVRAGIAAVLAQPAPRTTATMAEAR